MLPETVMNRLEAISTLIASGKRVNGLYRLMKCRALWELCWIFGDGVDQAADFFSAATSIPSRNVTPLTTFGN
jgi:hypothetical protein